MRKEGSWPLKCSKPRESLHAVTGGDYRIEGGVNNQIRRKGNLKSRGTDLRRGGERNLASPGTWQKTAAEVSTRDEKRATGPRKYHCKYREARSGGRKLPGRISRLPTMSNNSLGKKKERAFGPKTDVSEGEGGLELHRED